jgi:predicted nucleic acid-binding protein
VTARVLLDTGPLVAFLNARDQHHAWAVAELGKAAPPLATCEAVLSEACFLLRKVPGGPEKVLALLERGLLVLPFRLDTEVARVAELMLRYAELPMSLADACLVRMLELDLGTEVMTLDGDFRVYRKNRRQVVRVRMPG